MSLASGKIYIDPSYSVFDQDRLFDLDDPILNRDDQLLPFHTLRQQLNAQGKDVHTADFLLSGHAEPNLANEYVSLGIMGNYSSIERNGLASLKAFVFMEPPVVAPELYRALPDLTRAFKRVYLPNTHGDGYSLKGVRKERLHRLYWPIPFQAVLSHYWENEQRQRRLVVINGSHRPRIRDGEQYSTRIRAMAELARFGCVDLYGRGWDRWWSREALWYPYWRHYRTLMSIYKGPCTSKYEVLSRYTFSLCFENTRMDGYLTEKIFDCLYAGTIPLYLGAPNVSPPVPPEAFIDCRNFGSWGETWKAIENMPASEIRAYRDAGREFLSSSSCQPFHQSLANIFAGPT